MIISGKKDPAAKDSVVHVVQGNSSRVTVGMGQNEDPPPYIREQAQPLARPASFPHPQPRAQTRPTLPPRPPLATSTSSLSQFGNANSNTTNHLFVKTRHESLDGVFRIDPALNTVALGKGSLTTLARREYNQTHRQKHRHHGRRGFWKRTEAPEPNAIFETRQGAMAIDLSIVAGIRPLHARALVQAATKQGAVNINVHAIDPMRNLNLEVSTRHGDIHILIPRAFSGYIQMYNKHGDRVVLPSLANDSELVYRREKDTQVAVGAPVSGLPVKGSDWTGDTIHVSSRHGDIHIGYLGEDTFPVPEPGFWKKVTDFFQK